MLLASCSGSSIQKSVTAVPTSRVTPTLSPSFTFIPSASPVRTIQPSLTATPKATPTLVVPALDLPHSIYLLFGNTSYSDGNALYRIKKGNTTAELLNPPGEDVTCFDISKDGKFLAIGTNSGKIYTQQENNQPQLLLDTSLHSEHPTFINSISWAPDNKRLAYTVDLREHDLHILPYPMQPSGLWIVDDLGKNPIWLISNNYVT